MSLRVDTSSWIGEALLVGDRGLGVLGSEVPSSGESGAGYLYNDLSLPVDADKEVCGRITTWPSAGALTAYEDSSFAFTGAPDGTYSFQYQLYVDGVATGSPTTVTLQVGGTAATLAITLGADAVSGGASVSPLCGMGIIAAADVFSGDAGLSPQCALGIATAADAFNGAAGTDLSAASVILSARSAGGTRHQLATRAPRLSQGIRR